MRSALRSLTLGLLGLLGTGAMAQYPYEWVIMGTVTNCYPGQTIHIQTVQGTDPAYDMNIPVDSVGCSFSVTLGINSAMAWAQWSTLCQGAIVGGSAPATFNSLGDTALTITTIDCGGIFDCMGALNGPNMPGTACDDNDPLTFNDTWSANCVCTGQDTTGTWDCLQMWNGPNMPGTMCVNFLGDTGVWSVQCQCQTNSDVYDCSGLLNGPNLPGTACDDNDPATNPDIWSPNCVCVGQDTSYYDCLGVANGQNLPGTACTYTLDSITYITSIWTPNCVCGPDSNLFQYDCLGQLNGNALPGTPCTIPGTIIEGTWSANCVCEDNNPAPCNADFWVMQAWGQDSLPVPSELWVWNLSSGGSGTYTFVWSFGDGTSSTDPFPTHTYQDNGPYALCLTIDDGAGCVDTHCDSVSVDDNGILNGMIGEGNRTNGFTINIQDPNANAIEELMSGEGLTIWPNPVQDELNIALVGRMSGAVEVTITDLNGRIVQNERSTLSNGKNQLHLSSSDLGAGMYMVRIANNDRTLTQRFVKAN